MRELWRKTFELFRRNPILWVPYVCAETLAFCLSTLRRMAYKPILYWFAKSNGRSVLGGHTVTYDWPKAQHRAFLTTLPLEWVMRYLNACLLTAALVVTAVCVAKLAYFQKPDGGNALKALRANAKAILNYALKFCILVLATTIVLEVPLSHVTVHLNVGQTKYYPFVIAGALASYSLVAWIMAPVALALLRASDAPPFAAQKKNLSRYSSILVVFSTAILEFAIPRLETHIQLRSTPAVTALFALNDLLINLPLLFLFIALALLAVEAPLNAAPETALHLPQSIKNLMPLHFPPANGSE